MLQRAAAWVLSLMVSLSAGCTFYTSCPSGNGNNNPTGAGGSGGSSGSGGLAGGPPLTGMWVNATANLAGKDSVCGNLRGVSSKPDEDMLLTNVTQAGMWASTDGGVSWSALGTGAGSAPITNAFSSISYDPSSPQTFWETGLYYGDGVFVTKDDGATFAAVGTITHNDYLSVDFTDPARQTMLASGHEQPHKLYKTSDAGGMWSEIGDKIPSAQQTCPYPVILDAQTYLLGCGSYAGGAIGILRSTDAGASWQSVSDHGGASAPLFAANGAIYWATESSAGIVKSTDQGVTWGSPLGAGIVGGDTPVELPDGRLAALNGRHVVVSADDGLKWSQVTVDLGFDPNGFIYSVPQKAFFAWHFTCDAGSNPVPADAIMRYDFDYAAAASP